MTTSPSAPWSVVIPSGPTSQAVAPCTFERSPFYMVRGRGALLQGRAHVRTYMYVHVQIDTGSACYA